MGVGTDYVPAEYVSLHTQILNKRDTFLAHSDLNIKDARLHVENNNWGKSALISQNIVDVTAEFLKIDEILDLIEKTILAMYKEQDLLISGLTPDA